VDEISFCELETSIPVSDKAKSSVRPYNVSTAWKRDLVQGTGSLYAIGQNKEFATKRKLVRSALDGLLDKDWRLTVERDANAQHKDLVTCLGNRSSLSDS
jgi:hypothetical protein